MPDESKESRGNATQRREYFRAEVFESEPFIVSVKIGSACLTGCRLLNISIGGTAILTVQQQKLLDINTTINEIVIKFPDGHELKTPAIVRYALKESDSEWDTYGIQFIGLSHAESRIIGSYVLQAEAVKFRALRPMQRVDVSESEPFEVILKLDVGSIEECKLLNIGVGGAAILAARHPIALAIDTTIKEVAIKFPSGEEVRTPAAVIHILEDSESECNTYGVQFIGLSNAQSYIIAKYIHLTEEKKIKEQQDVPI